MLKQQMWLLLVISVENSSISMRRILADIYEKQAEESSGESSAQRSKEYDNEGHSTDSVLLSITVQFV
jgi:hypothetical protein